MAFYDHSYDKLNFKLSAYAKNLDSSSKQTYIDKLIINKPDGSFFRIPDPFTLKQEDWKTDISMYPKITNEDITKYLEPSPRKNHRPLSAYNYVVSGKVQGVKVFVPNGLPEFVLLFANVQLSQKHNIRFHKTWVISKKNGEIRTAHCTCIAGFGEFCSHVFAVLYNVQFAMSVGLTSDPTENHCEWNNNFSEKVKAIPVKDMDWSKIKCGRCGKKKRYTYIPPKEVAPVTAEQLAELSFSPNSVIFTAFADGSSTDTASDSEDDDDDRLTPV